MGGALVAMVLAGCLGGTPQFDAATPFQALHLRYESTTIWDGGDSTQSEREYVLDGPHRIRDADGAWIEAYALHLLGEDARNIWFFDSSARWVRSDTECAIRPAEHGCDEAIHRIRWPGGAAQLSAAQLGFGLPALIDTQGRLIVVEHGATRELDVKVERSRDQLTLRQESDNYGIAFTYAAGDPVPRHIQQWGGFDNRTYTHSMELKEVIRGDTLPPAPAAPWLSLPKTPPAGNAVFLRDEGEDHAGRGFTLLDAWEALIEDHPTVAESLHAGGCVLRLMTHSGFGNRYPVQESPLAYGSTWYRFTVDSGSGSITSWSVQHSAYRVADGMLPALLADTTVEKGETRSGAPRCELAQGNPVPQMGIGDVLAAADAMGLFVDERQWVVTYEPAAPEFAERASEDGRSLLRYTTWAPLGDTNFRRTLEFHAHSGWLVMAELSPAEAHEYAHVPPWPGMP